MEVLAIQDWTYADKLTLLHARKPENLITISKRSVMPSRCKLVYCMVANRTKK